MENITGTEMQGIQKMGYREIIYSCQIGFTYFSALYGHILKRMLKIDFSAVMLNCNNWIDFWRIVWFNTDEKLPEPFQPDYTEHLEEELYPVAAIKRGFCHLILLNFTWLCAFILKLCQWKFCIIFAKEMFFKIVKFVILYSVPV